MLAMLSHKLSPQHNATTCITGNCGLPVLSITFFFYYSKCFSIIKKKFWYFVKLFVRIVKVADLEGCIDHFR